EPQDGGLARPARPDERHALAGLHGEVELAEHDVLAEPLDHLLEADAGGGAPRQRRGGPAALRLVLLRAVLLHAVLLRGHAFGIIGRRGFGCGVSGWHSASPSGGPLSRTGR